MRGGEVEADIVGGGPPLSGSSEAAWGVDSAPGASAQRCGIGAPGVLLPTGGCTRPGPVRGDAGCACLGPRAPALRRETSEPRVRCCEGPITSAAIGGPGVACGFVEATGLPGSNGAPASAPAEPVAPVGEGTAEDVAVAGADSCPCINKEVAGPMGLPAMGARTADGGVFAGAKIAEAQDEEGDMPGTLVKAASCSAASASMALRHLTASSFAPSMPNNAGENAASDTST